MAKMTFAAFQIDMIPLLVVLIFCCWEYDYAPSYYGLEHGERRRLKPLGVHLLFQGLVVWYLIRIVVWTHSAMQSLCERLDVNVFTIKHKQHPKKEKKN